MPQTYPLTTAATPAQSGLRESVPFTARALQCDNFTNQWFKVTESGLYVPPYFTDRVMLLPNVNTLTITDEAPPTYQEPALIAGQLANFTAWEDALAPSAGVYQPPFGAQQFAPQQSGQISSATAAAVSQRILLPPQGLYLVYTPSSGAPSSFSVTGYPSGAIYTPLPVSVLGGGPAFGQFPGVYLYYLPSTQLTLGPSNVNDNQLTLSVTGGGGVNPNASLAWALDGPPSLIWNDPSRPLYIAAPAGNALQVQAASAFPVSMQGQAVAPWQAPDHAVAITAAIALAINGSSVVIAAPGAGLALYLHSLSLVEAVSNSVNVWESTDGTMQVYTDVPTARGGSNTAFIQVDDVELKGIRLPTNTGLRVRNTNSTASGNMWPSLRYSVAA